METIEWYDRANQWSSRSSARGWTARPRRTAICRTVTARATSSTLSSDDRICEVIHRRLLALSTSRLTPTSSQVEDRITSTSTSGGLISICTSVAARRSGQAKPCTARRRQRATYAYEDTDTSDFDVVDGFISLCTEFKYLGSIIHYSLTSHANVMARIDSASRAFGTVR